MSAQRASQAQANDSLRLLALPGVAFQGSLVYSRVLCVPQFQVRGMRIKYAIFSP